jgi:hypothetical protein
MNNAALHRSSSLIIAYLFACLPVCLFACLPVCLFACLPVCPGAGGRQFVSIRAY